jgi:hypothetical protein
VLIVQLFKFNRSSRLDSGWRVQILVSVMKFVAIAAMLIAIVTCIVKETRPDLVVLNKTAVIMGICWNGAGLALLMMLYTRWTWRVCYSVWTKRVWSERRWKGIQVRAVHLLVRMLLEFNQ